MGIAELCAEAGISKETLYRHFGSKDGLIRAVLEARSDRVTRWLARAAADAGDEPAAQLAAVFDALRLWYNEPGFRGCAIVNAATQHHTAPASTIAARHLGRYLDLLTAIATRAGAANPAAPGRQLLLLSSKARSWSSTTTRARAPRTTPGTRPSPFATTHRTDEHSLRQVAQATAALHQLLTEVIAWTQAVAPVRAA
ncbi:TetR/AcrR family transcriptional regulator [Plantactinospora sp. DSM 117369]